MAVTILAIIIFLVIAFLRNNLSFANFNAIWKDITTTVTIITVICTLFISWAWKWKIFQNWLVPFPCLSGKWLGHINSTYDSANIPIEVEVTIKQNFFYIQIKIKSKESSSFSTCGSFDIDEDRGFKQLIYTYQNNPKATVKDRSAIHYGTTRLDIDDNLQTLEGEYWTTRKTTGDIKLVKQ